MLKGTRRAKARTRRVLKKTAVISKKVAVPQMKDTTKAQVTSLVKTMLARKIENKLVGWQPEQNVLHNSGITLGDCVPVIGQITQGTSPTRRIGDKITPKSLKLHGVVSMTPAGCNTAQNIWVRVIVAAQKTIKVGSQITGIGVDTPHLVRTGIDGFDQTSFDGTTRSLNYLMNKDAFVVYYDRVHMLAPSNVDGGAVECMPRYSFRWSYNFKKLPASFGFDTLNGDWVNNFAPFVAIGYAYPDGSAPDVTTQKIVSNTNSFLEFEDA